MQAGTLTLSSVCSRPPWFSEERVKPSTSSPGGTNCMGEEAGRTVLW